MTSISGGGDLVFGTDGGDLTFNQHRVTLLSPTVYYGDPQKIIDRLLDSGADIADLPAPAVAVDNNDIVPVVVDGVLSAAEIDDLPFLLLNGDSAVSGEVTFDDGTGKIKIGADGSGNTQLAVTNEAGTYAYVAAGQLLGGGAISLGDGAGTVDVVLYRSAAGVATLLLGDLRVTTAGTNAASVALVGGTQTLTNKRVTKRVGTTASSATPTINTDNVDIYRITAQAAAITSFTTNLSGTPTDGQELVISITDNGTARAITWGASFEASTVALPTTTVISTRLDVTFRWNTVTSKWRCIQVA